MHLPRKSLISLGLACASLAMSTGALAQSVPAIEVLAAGSLHEALEELGNVYSVNGRALVKLEFGPSGKLRGEIEKGRKMDVFASASIEHTDKLATAGLLSASEVFTHNDLCVVSTAALELTPANLLQVLTAPATRLATSTPVSDPMGDYTWQFFRKAESRRPGSYDILDKKALKLSGAAAPKPGEKLPYVKAFEENQADAYVMYCTNAVNTKRSVPAVVITRIPDELNVRSAYGIGASPQSPAGQQFVKFVMSEEGQRILKKHGFN